MPTIKRKALKKEPPKNLVRGPQKPKATPTKTPTAPASPASKPKKPAPPPYNPQLPGGPYWLGRDPSLATKKKK